MSVLINKKRCDNADACDCITGCPTGAFYWNEKESTISVNDNLCINCRACVIACGAGAVKVPRNEEEYNQIKTEFDEDLMTREELFQDRYGAAIVDESYNLELTELENLINESNKALLIEVYNIDESNCLINSLLISEIIKKIPYPVAYRKLNLEKADDLTKYEIKTLPALLLIKNKEVIFKYEGFVDCNDANELLSSLSEASIEKK